MVTVFKKIDKKMENASNNQNYKNESHENGISKKKKNWNNNEFNKFYSKLGATDNEIAN